MPFFHLAAAIDWLESSPMSLSIVLLLSFNSL